MSAKEPRPHKERELESDSYKLVLFRAEDLHEVRSFNLSLSSIYVFTSMLLLSVITLLFSLLAFTPLKQLIPGYGKIESNHQFISIVNGVDDLTTKIEAQGTYIGALRTLLRTGLADPNIGALPELSDEVSPSQVPVMPSSLSSINGISPATQELANRSTTEKSLYLTLEQHKVYNPVEGLVSSEFDPDIKHFGIDILAPARTPIVSMMDGFVFSSGWDVETGFSIGIQHANNVLTFYKHNSQLLKEKGTFVRAGEAVSIIGNTGTLSSGPHLHLEIWHNGKPVNPKDILNL